MTKAEELMWNFVRDKSTRTERELRAEWEDQRDQLGLAKAASIVSGDPVDEQFFEKACTGHNPIYFVARSAWFDNEPRRLFRPFHMPLCDELLGARLAKPNDRSGTVLLGPRDSYKTTFTHGAFTQFDALRCYHVENREPRTLLLHHKEDQASQNLKRLRKKSVESDWLKYYWPEMCAESDWDTSTELDWPRKKHGIIAETNVKAAGLGQKMTGFHYDLVLGSDLVTEEHLMSSIIRGEAIFRYAASRFTLDSETGREICDGTRWHIHDLWGKNLASEGKLDGNTFYRYKRWIRGAGGKRAGKPLAFPIRLSEEFLERRYAEIVDSTGNDLLWWLQYQNEVKSARQTVCDPEAIRHCSVEAVPVGLPVVILCDPAWKGGKNFGLGCDAAIGAFALERRGGTSRFYMLETVVSNEMSSTEGVDEICRLARRWAAYDIGIEESGGYAFRTAVEEACSDRDIPVALVDFKTRNVGKNDRISTFLRHVEAGRFFAVEGCGNMDVFNKQVEDFPQADPVDMLDMAAYLADPNVIALAAPPAQYGSRAAVMGGQYQRRTRHCTM